MDKMQSIYISKVVLNIGTGSDSNMHDNAVKILQVITNAKPTDGISKKRNPAFKVSKGQKIGALVTLRGKKAIDLLPRLFDAVDNKIGRSSISTNSVNFGIKEYIDISGIKYDPKIGMLGMNVNVAFSRPGMRAALRKRKRARIPAKHSIISADEIKDYIKENFKVEVVQ
ncbi:MAG: 50S ribosomal protein L5 [Candidatus Marsarchaeota archaeon]|jgi:large subunit ribosomal protein L5|nr:50S ribosomal protein L5 [Candidatus Marsarchaeota archaeon]MCL5418369.1 50S ribosomal protein L5 [Candidatus Marsarchaeota archaeon]